MKTILTLCLALMPFTMTLAQDAAEKSPAAELLDLMKFKQVMKDTSSAAFSPFLNQLRKQGFPEAGVKEVEEAAGVYFDQVASDPDLKKAMMELYEKEFTAEEIKGLLAFYGTPLGQKALQRMPVLMQSGAKLGEKFALKHQAGFKEQMTRIMQKYKPAPNAEGAGE